MTTPSSSPEDRRTAANRENAQKSTGPRTPEGKARVAQNRTTHGLTGAHAILPNEDPAAFDRLKESLQAEHKPYSETEHHLIDELAHAQWKLRRAEAMELAALARAIDPETGLPILTDEITRLRQLQADRRKDFSLALDAAYVKAMQQRSAAAPPPAAQEARDDSNPIPPPAAAPPDHPATQ